MFHVMEIKCYKSILIALLFNFFTNYAKGQAFFFQGQFVQLQPVYENAQGLSRPLVLMLSLISSELPFHKSEYESKTITYTQ